MSRWGGNCPAGECPIMSLVFKRQMFIVSEGHHKSVYIVHKYFILDVILAFLSDLEEPGSTKFGRSLLPIL